MLTKGLIKNIGFQVVVAMVLGAVVGAFMGEQATVFAPLGTLFIQLIKMLVIPLVAVAILSGAANLGASPAAGKIGAATLAFFLVTSALAVLLALVMGQIFKPGVGVDFASVASMFGGDYADKGALPDAVATLLGMIPTNVFNSLNEANILQILVFCMFLGIALAKQPRERAKPLVDGLNTLVDAFVWMINKVMIIAPLGVFGLMAGSHRYLWLRCADPGTQAVRGLCGCHPYLRLCGLPAAGDDVLQHAGNEVPLCHEEAADRGLLHRLFHGDPAGQYGDLRA